MEKKGKKVATNWGSGINDIYKIISNNKLRQIAFNLFFFFFFLVARKELKRFGLTLEDNCTECDKPDLIEHNFSECNLTLRFYQEILQRFNIWHTTCLNPTEQQILVVPHALR